MLVDDDIATREITMHKYGRKVIKLRLYVLLDERLLLKAFIRLTLVESTLALLSNVFMLSESLALVCKKINGVIMAIKKMNRLLDEII